MYSRAQRRRICKLAAQISTAPPDWVIERLVGQLCAVELGMAEIEIVPVDVHRLVSRETAPSGNVGQLQARLLVAFRADPRRDGVGEA